MSRWFAQLRVAFRSLFRRQRVEEELDEEIRYHLERQIEEGLKDGLAPDEARYAALRAMGAVARSKEESRDLQTARFFDDFVGDLLPSRRELRDDRHDGGVRAHGERRCAVLPCLCS